MFSADKALHDFYCVHQLAGRMLPNLRFRYRFYLLNKLDVVLLRDNSDFRIVWLLEGWVVFVYVFLCVFVVYGVFEFLNNVRIFRSCFYKTDFAHLIKLLITIDPSIKHHWFSLCELQLLSLAALFLCWWCLALQCSSVVVLALGLENCLSTL